MKSILYILVIVLLTINQTNGLNNGILKPAMGWSSWNKFACEINETIIMEMALTMSKNGMKDIGYEYINIDDCWAAPERTSEGVIQADPITFPNGIAYIADYVHSLGLKLGIYTDCGVLTCKKRPGSYGYEELDAKTYAEWGIDYVKEDWCFTFLASPETRYKIMSDALNSTGRQMYFSMCSWGVGEPWNFGPSVGNSWRNTGDIQDNWDSFIVTLMAQVPIAGYSGPGFFNDPDSLEVGNGKMTNIEYQSQFSLWSLLMAPLISGNDLRTMDNETFAILTAPEVIAVNQDPLGKQGTLVKAYYNGQLQIWARPLIDGSRAVVLFNTINETISSIEFEFTDIWFDSTSTYSVRDLWAQTDLGNFIQSYSSDPIPPHGCSMLKVTLNSNKYM